MKYLIDTCILSELVKKTPNPLIVQWFNQQKPEQLYISNITLAEIKKGLYKIKNTQPERYRTLFEWLKSLESRFSGRILPVTDGVLECWAEIAAGAELQGKKLAVMDSLIAATAYHHQLTLVTRNVDDFIAIPLNIINPYNPA